MYKRRHNYGVYRGTVLLPVYVKRSNSIYKAKPPCILKVYNHVSKEMKDDLHTGACYPIPNTDASKMGIKPHTLVPRQILNVKLEKLIVY